MSEQNNEQRSQAAGTDTVDRGNSNAKLEQLEAYREDATGEALSTNTGTRIADNQNTLKAGERGPSLLEDFIMREKITHFDHERIPERVVHARGSAAHGYFEAYEDLSDLTKAGFLAEAGKRTPVFVRFSTLQQAARRSWRIGHKHPVRVVFFGYAGSSQITCLQLMAKKIAVAQSTSGDVPESGLDSLNQDGDSVEMALARQLIAA